MGQCRRNSRVGWRGGGRRSRPSSCRCGRRARPRARLCADHRPHAVADAHLDAGALTARRGARLLRLKLHAKHVGDAPQARRVYGNAGEEVGEHKDVAPIVRAGADEAQGGQRRDARKQRCRRGEAVVGGKKGGAHRDPRPQQRVGHEHPPDRAGGQVREEGGERAAQLPRIRRPRQGRGVGRRRPAWWGRHQRTQPDGNGEQVGKEEGHPPAVHRLDGRRRFLRRPTGRGRPAVHAIGHNGPIGSHLVRRRWGLWREGRLHVQRHGPRRQHVAPQHVARGEQLRRGRR